MIIDIRKFIKKQEPLWKELELFLDGIDNNSLPNLSLEKIKRLNYLYSVVSEDLVKISTFTGEEEILKYLQIVVARAYATIHTKKQQKASYSFIKIINSSALWFFFEFPRAFRRNFAAFMISLLITIFGVIFGGVAITVDSDAKEVIFPQQFAHLYQSPDERVKKEESKGNYDRLQGQHATFAASLMTNNIRVSINALVLGVFWGIGTVVILFYNGVILGAVAFDYILSGHLTFLMGWLLPHGVIEIPAILIAGQAGLILGDSLLRVKGSTRIARLRSNMKDIVSLIGGVAVLLVWAGIIESFLSQYHEPTIPYSLKIAFGIVELIIFVGFLAYPFKRKVEKEEVL